MNVQDARLQRKRLTTHYVCRECFQAGKFTALIEKRIEGQFAVVCAEHPSHKQHVREVTAMARLRQQERDAQEVFSRYPFLDPSPITESVAESIAALFG